MVSYGGTDSLTHFLHSFLAELDLCMAICGLKDIASTASRRRAANRLRLPRSDSETSLGRQPRVEGGKLVDTDSAQVGVEHLSDQPIDAAGSVVGSHRAS